jgi:pyruvate dehydrogenase E2 component (dihydrolipoamide acetyltransferase)
MAHPILVPPLGQTTDTVVLSAWYKQEGQPVQAGEPLFAIETDKATLDIEAQDSGILSQVTAQAGEEVKVLSPIGLIAAPGEQGSGGEGEQGRGGARERGSTGAVAAGFTPAQDTAGSTHIPVRAVSAPAQHPSITVTVTRERKSERTRTFISPRARRLAEDQRMDWQQVIGTGPEGAIVERDVREALAAFSQAPTPAPQIATTPMVTTPTLPAAPAAAQFLSTQADASALLELVKRYSERGRLVSFESLLLYIVMQVLHGFRDDLGVQGEICLGYVTAGTDEFIVVPLAHDVTHGLSQLTRELDELTRQAWSGAAPEVASGSFACVVAYFGAYGVDVFTPVVDLSGVPFLGVGRPHRQRSGEVLAWFTLSYTGARLSGPAAARLLQQIVQRVEDPDLMF